MDVGCNISQCASHWILGPHPFIEQVGNVAPRLNILRSNPVYQNLESWKETTTVWIVTIRRSHLFEKSVMSLQGLDDLPYSSETMISWRCKPTIENNGQFS